MIAPSRKPPLHLRISVTDRCQLRCLYCMPEAGIPQCRRQDVLRFEEIAGFIRLLGPCFDVRKVRLTGGDPLARRRVVFLVGMLAELGIPDLAMTTNAQGLADTATELRAAGLQRVNISLDSLKPDTFARITRGGDLRRTLDGIDAALRAGLRPVKLNMVVLGGINDAEVADVLSFAIVRGCEMRFLELMPIGCAHKDAEAVFEPVGAVKERLAADFSMSPLPFERGATARRYAVKGANGARGVVGFISPCSDPFCDGCARLRLTADGRLMGCLAREDGVDIRRLLRQGNAAALAATVDRALRCKRVDSRFAQSATMAAIGG